MNEKRDECVMWGPEVADGRMTPIYCVSHLCRFVGECARDRDAAMS